MSLYDDACFYTLRCAGMSEKEASQNTPRIAKLPDNLRAAVSGGMMSLKDAENAARQLQPPKPKKV